MRSSYGTTGMTPVLAAGVGIRHGWTWVLRAASFRLEVPDAGLPAIGIAITRETARAAVVDLLGGLARPAYGELRVLGQDTAIVATGRDPAALAMACGEVLTLADGIIVRNLPAQAAHFGGMRARARDAGGSALRWTR